MTRRDESPKGLYADGIGIAHFIAEPMQSVCEKDGGQKIEEEKWNNEFVGFAEREAAEILVSLEKQPAKEEIEGHAECGEKRRSWETDIEEVDDVYGCDEDNTEAFSEVYVVDSTPPVKF